jgi:hypothetical protein
MRFGGCAGVFAALLAAALAPRAAAEDGPPIRVVSPGQRAPAAAPVNISAAQASATFAASFSQPASVEPSIALRQPAAAAAVEPVAPETIPPGPSQRRQFRPITQITANAALPPGLLPEQVERTADEAAPVTTPLVGDLRLLGGWGGSVFEWSATSRCHGPLYFEEINLERYGYQCHPLVQPFVSGAHFFLTVPTLPYQMTVHPPRECIYTLGHYRPGSRAPWQRQRLPWDARAAVVEAGVAVGLVFLIP